MRRAPTDYPTRARVYRASAAKAWAAGDESTARQCEEFARRCDERAVSLALR
ncbi:hypothetical protein [Mycolicibacterium nivoides]|uniref:Uncharacterized protein n=1 Tax=Mycolicibacterium nivoides TaxID=2487344 RepID=A0ABW9LJA9_9MYCO